MQPSCRLVQLTRANALPWGTLAVNAAGSLLLGVLAGAALVGGATSTAGLLVGVGFCGALTTYSTLSYGMARLVEQRARLYALANMAGTIVAGLAAATAGYLGAQALTG